MTFQALVIGGGAIGLSSAIELCRRGMRVALADHGQQSGVSTWAGAGILSTLPPWGYDEAVSGLALAGMKAWPDWAANLERHARTSPEFWTCGMQVTTQVKDRQPAIDWCQSHRLPAEMRSDGIWLPGISQARNPRLLAAMNEALQDLGGRCLSDCEVLSVESQKRRIDSIQTTLGNFAADLFILATGAWSGLPLSSMTPVPNIRPMRGQMLLYAPGSHTLDHIILDDGFYLVPRKDGHLLAGSTVEDAGFISSTTPEALKMLHESASRILPSLKNHEPINSWAGLRPGSPENLPIIDRHPQFENLWVHAGHFRYGVTMAPASSRLLAELITGKAPFLDPEPYSWQAASRRKWPEVAAC